MSLEDKLYEAAFSVLKKNLEVAPREEILIVCDETRVRIADALAIAADKLRARPCILLVTEGFRRSKSILDPKLSEGLKDAIKSMDVIVLCLANIGNELNFRRIFLRATRRYPVRVANLPGITNETFQIIAKTSKPQFMEQIGNDAAILFANGRKARVTSPAGTDIQFSLYGWSVPPEISSGYISQASIWGNLPGAEVYVAPVLRSAEGRIVIDVTIDPDYRLTAPVCLTVRKGRVSPDNVDSADNKAKEHVLETLKERNGDLICEFGIGLNHGITSPTGIVLIDEKMYSTAHFAIGDNKEFGGKIKSKIHYDMVFSKPTVWIDDMKIMEDGMFEYSAMELKNDYKIFDGLLPESTVVKASPWATCARLGGGLARLWRGGTNRIHAYVLGNRKTSRMAESVWTTIRHGGSTIGELSSELKVDVDTVKKVVEFLIYHGVLEVSSRKESNNIEKLGKNSDRETIELL